jgi:hypothetical protein
MQPECSQEPDTAPYSKPDESIPHSHILTPCSRFVVEKLIVDEIVEKFTEGLSPLS